MGVASFSQTSFLGGEWSKQMQGRFDREDYRTGLNICLNLIPTEEGCLTRRPGTQLGGVTRGGLPAALLRYGIDGANPYNIELTDGHLRLWQSGAGLVTLEGTLVTAVSATDPATFTAAAHGLVGGDQVIFTVEAATYYGGVSVVLGARQLVVSNVIDADNFQVIDAITGDTISGLKINMDDFTTLEVRKIYDLPAPYNDEDIHKTNIVQDGSTALLLNHRRPIQSFIPRAAELGTVRFLDGPYLDIPSDGTTLTPNALTGNITFTASSIASINDGRGFETADFGRLFRVFSEPAVWAVATAYAIGDKVKEADTYWKSVKASTGVQPSTDNGVNWVIDTAAAAWTWGTIFETPSSTTFIGMLAAPVTSPENVASGDLLYTTPITAWQLGAYTSSVGFPNVGAYYQGRIWLGGAIKNRFDACVSNQFDVDGAINFAPTGKDGTVADNSAISGTLNALEIENFLWMLPDEQGILAGTELGEWVIASSAANEPITPTSIQTREMTHYGSSVASGTPAIKIDRSTIFIHRDGLKIYEYMANYFTQKFIADNLILKSKHLTEGGAFSVTYQRELTPIIWVSLQNGGLVGCTYKHDDPIKPIEINAWHRQSFGTGRKVVSLQGGPSTGGTNDTLALVTQDPNTALAYVEFLQSLPKAGDTLLNAWHVDGGVVPAGADQLTVGTYMGVNAPVWSATVTYTTDDYVVGSDDIVYQCIAYTSVNQDPVSDGGVNWTSTGATVTTFPILRLYGLWYMVGDTVSVWGVGLDLGDYTVAADASIDVPLNTASASFTTDRLRDATIGGCTGFNMAIASAASAGTTSYVMAGENNFTGATAANRDTYQASPGATFDYARRVIMYTASVYNNAVTTNNTGFNLWSGQNKIAKNASYSAVSQRNLYIGEKNIDTGQVAWHYSYGQAQTVPSGLQLGMAGTLVGGAGYVDGVYLGVPLSGGSGTGAFANIVVVGGAVTFLARVYNPNGGYAVADVLTTANTHLGGAGAGFTYTITGFDGTSDGTYRRFVESQDKAFPLLVDPRTGNVWFHVDSLSGDYICTVYMLPREVVQPSSSPVLEPLAAAPSGCCDHPDASAPVKLSDQFVQTISPLLPTHYASHMEPIGISDNWAYIVESTGSAEPSNYHLCLSPRTIEAQETAADHLLTYANFAFPTLFNNMSSGPNAFVFTRKQTTYFLKMAIKSGGTSIARGYKLYRFDEPSAAPFAGPVVGGGFTDVTPWAVGTGPNTNAASYTYNQATGQDKWSYPTNNFLYYLSTQDQVAIVSKFFSWQTSNTLVTDPTLTFFDLTYYDIAGATFDYHHAFVRGYMKADWTPLSSATDAAWIVIDALQLNSFASYNTYTFPGHDYTKVWFAFTVQPYDAAFATPDKDLWHTIFVQYQLAYGSAPAVLQIIDEAHWDDAYINYGTDIGNANVVWNSQGVTNQDEISNAGIYDPKTRAFWWGGDSNLLQLPDASGNPPFLKLTASSGADPYCAPFAVGSTYCSVGQIVRPLTPPESGTQSGPSLGKNRRMVYAAPLLENAKGVSMGVDFFKMRPLAFMSAGGTVPLADTETFSGVYWGTVDAESNYDNLWCFEICRPYPCTLTAVECQLTTNENL